MSDIQVTNTIFESDNEVVKQFREGLMHRIAKRPHIEQPQFFERLVRSVIEPGNVDITGWNSDAVSILLKICSESDDPFVFVNDGIKMSFARFPHGRLFEALAKAITSGQL
jgi:hypothetical protein